ncbi:hypothetical protein FVF58_09440 [Paraburkholderia panacisoli]|uniref:Uncharacterized protein n=1 Tax=Paraburkholderia panacisoli TaxID=2603818 RepID=A0A5B0HDF1_9BURK|nr:hypothetical protein [Paraburkholderia panacisoli]KAA1013004.1 hypothetical protein FVF58_09440 [Paraburkholderia panacisoli]
MTNFQSEWAGNETDRSGDALFKVGEIERAVHFNEFTDYHAIAQLLNEARKVGREEAAKEFAWRVSQVAREMGVEA